MISSVLVAFTIYKNPKLRQHPATIIALIALCEGISCFNALVWAIDPIDFICYFGLHYIFSWTTLGIVPRADAMKLLCTSNSWMYTFFQNTSLAFNLCLCHDLVRTLKNPFQPQGRRMKFYMGFSIISASLFTIAS
jgi:hypothetical protein